MPNLTTIHCLICGEAHPYPWAKSDRLEHLKTHLDDSFMKMYFEGQGDETREDLIHIAGTFLGDGSIGEWLETRKEWDVNYEE